MNYWDQAAVSFDSLYDRNRKLSYAVNRVLRRGLFQRLDITCQWLRTVTTPTVLDVGCGSGRNISGYFAAGSSRVTGIDSSEEMLKLARQQTAASMDKVQLLSGDFLNVEFAETFDCVIALGVFDYLSHEAVEFLIKMARLARHGVAFSAPGKSLLRQPLRARRYRHNGVEVSFYNPQDLRALCNAAGLPGAEIRSCSSSGYMVIAKPAT